MFGIGPMELIVIAIFAIVFIGPQNLPHALGKFAKFFVKARRYSTDIKVGFDDMVRKAESEMHLEEVKANLDSLKETAAIDGSSLKPLTSQETLKPTHTGGNIEQGVAGEALAQGTSSGDDDRSGADEALLYAGMPSHLGGRAVNPSFDDLDPSQIPELADHQAGEAPKPQQPAQAKAAGSQNLAQTEQPPENMDADHHEEMVKQLRGKLPPEEPKS